LKSKEIPNKLKIEMLDYLAEHLSFIKLINRFPMVSMEDVQNILRKSAEFYQCNLEDHSSLNRYDYFLYTDGASRGNPGEAGAGAVVIDQKGNVIMEFSKYLGQNTNNVAEYLALIFGLREVLSIGGNSVRVFSDSELMVKQLNGAYRVKNEKLILLYNEVKKLLERFGQYDIMHIKREKNHHADRLANVAIDEKHEEGLTFNEASFI